MGDKTKISWTDATWNPATGCTPVSDGCPNCYAARYAMRRIGDFAPECTTLDSTYVPIVKPRRFSEVRTHPDRLETPLHWRKPRRIFVCSMGDWRHPNVPMGFAMQILAIAALCPQHTFQFLTKRADRQLATLASVDARDWCFDSAQKILHDRREKDIRDMSWDMPAWPLPNVWLGVTCENQAAADERIPLLLQTPAAVRFVSCEPMLGPIDIGRFVGLPGAKTDDPGGRCANCGKEANKSEHRITDNLYDGEWACSELCDAQLEKLGCPLEHKPLSWVIAGGETGPGARAMNPDWVRSLRDQCQAAGVAFHLKQLGEWTGCGTLTPDETFSGSASFNASYGTVCASFIYRRPDKFQMMDDGEIMQRVGKKAAGRMLDDREWLEFPDRRLL